MSPPHAEALHWRILRVTRGDSTAPGLLAKLAVGPVVLAWLVSLVLMPMFSAYMVTHVRGLVRRLQRPRPLPGVASTFDLAVTLALEPGCIRFRYEKRDVAIQAADVERAYVHASVLVLETASDVWSFEFPDRVAATRALSELELDPARRALSLFVGAGKEISLRSPRPCLRASTSSRRSAS